MCFFIILSPKRKHDGHVGLLALSVERIFQDICFTSEIFPLRAWCQVLDWEFSHLCFLINIWNQQSGCRFHLFLPTGQPAAHRKHTFFFAAQCRKQHMERPTDYTGRVKSPRWQPKSFPTLRPLAKTATLHEQDSIKGTLEQGGEAEVPSCTTKTKTDRIRRKRTVTQWLHRLPLRSAQHPAERSPLSLCFLPWEKKIPWVSNSYPSTEGHFVGLHGASLGSDYDREVGRDSPKPAHDLGRWSSLPPKNFDPLQTQVDSPLWPGNPLGCTFPCLWSSNKFCQSSSLVCLQPWKKLSHSPTHGGECSLTWSGQRAWLTALRSCVVQDCSSWEVSGSWLPTEQSQHGGLGSSSDMPMQKIHS